MIKEATKTQFSFAVETVTRYVIECSHCGEYDYDETDGNIDLTKSSFIDYLKSKGWKTVQSDYFQFEGICCPDCVAGFDSDPEYEP